MNKFSSNLLLALLTFAGVAILLAAAGDGEEARMMSREEAQRAQAIEVGAALYAEHCRTCHGINGEGVGQLGPALNDLVFFEERMIEVGWQGTLRDLVASTLSSGRVTATRPYYASDGNVAMVAWAQDYGGPLRPDQIEALADFVMNWEATARGEFQPAELVLPTPTPEALGEKAERGRALFLAAGCAECHAVAGISEGESGPALDGVAVAAAERIDGYSPEAYLRESFLIPNAYLVEGYDENAGCGGVVTEQQLDDLVAFLMSLDGSMSLDGNKD